ncbi:MAG: hypothetical protein ABJA93_06220 [Sporichthyaceae bacterium]
MRILERPADAGGAPGEGAPEPRRHGVTIADGIGVVEPDNVEAQIVEPILALLLLPDRLRSRVLDATVCLTNRPNSGK